MKRIALIIVVAALAACATPRPGAGGTPVRPRLGDILGPSDSDSVLAWYSGIKQLPATELARELEVARTAFQRQPGDVTRVRYALALAAVGRGVDTGKAQELLDPLVKDRSASLHGLAVLLNSHFAEQRRYDTDLGVAQLKAESVQQKLDSLQQKFDAAQQKLDALKTLEKNMSERREGSK